MKKLLLIAFVFVVSCKEKASEPVAAGIVEENTKHTLGLLQDAFSEKIDSLIPLAKRFTAAERYNEKIVFIADLSLHSGVERFAVVDLEADSVVRKALVAHGAGGRYFSDSARFSNTPNSLCSSPGKYKIGAKYNGRFGKAYKLYGLDITNNKAFERFIVLHGYDCVPDKSLYPQYLCNSEGCPMVSYSFLDILSQYIDNSSRPVLLWIIG